ncbi:MAG: HAD family phosphatase [Rikenellaceae bacterium]
MEIKLLLIDFDGTLVDTRQANYRAYRDVMKEVNFELDEELYLNNYFGMRCGEFMRQLGFTDSYEIDRMRRRKIEIYPNHFDTVKLNEPLWDFAQSFRAQGGKVWIVSTGQTVNIQTVMDHLSLNDKVDGLITGADVKNSKPSAECYLKVMNREGVAPSQSLIFEDSSVGIQAAIESGAHYIKVTL